MSSQLNVLLEAARAEVRAKHREKFNGLDAAILDAGVEKAVAESLGCAHDVRASQCETLRAYGKSPALSHVAGSLRARHLQELAMFFTLSGVSEETALAIAKEIVEEQ